MEEAASRLQQGAPSEHRAELIPTAWYQAWEAATIATDPEARNYNPPRVRSPAGAFVDLAEAAKTGKPLYDPEAITAKTLIVVGEWDGLTTSANAQALFARLTHASSKRLVEIGGATHFAHLERRRLELYETVQSFLEGFPQ
jgi:pimeloyl-ACP methyl ester carboxylesterase